MIVGISNRLTHETGIGGHQRAFSAPVAVLKFVAVEAAKRAGLTPTRLLLFLLLAASITRRVLLLSATIVLGV